ncbi:hypothetical protein CMI37_33925 [Candidatus Pacearchaeota archaeon]|nr:hypothetical protein [Candidatus Pacearchaeota archaeon]
MLPQKKIEAALSRSVCGGWDRDFLQSILGRIAKGRPLSVKQKQTLGKVLARNSAEHQKDHENWSVVFEKDYKLRGTVVAAYHAHQPYYGALSKDILAGKVPERGKFLRMFDNKYSKKVLAQHAATPKYPVGAYVIPRAAFDSYRTLEFETDIIWAHQNKVVQNFTKRGGFIIQVCEEIRSAAKGAKRYKILPVGSIIPLIVEERYIKVNRNHK